MIVIDFDSWAVRRGARWGTLSSFCVHHSKVVVFIIPRSHTGAELVLYFSKFFLRKCSLVIILFHSTDAWDSSTCLLQFKTREEKQTMVETGWNWAFLTWTEKNHRIPHGRWTSRVIQYGPLGVRGSISEYLNIYSTEKSYTAESNSAVWMLALLLKNMWPWENFLIFLKSYFYYYIHF